MKVWNEKKEKNEILDKHYTSQVIKTNNKKAVIIVDLVPEANKAEKKQIENEIVKEAQIPWCAKIEKVEIN